MSIKAYILIAVEKGQADSVDAELSHREGILTVDPVFGQYDVVALIEAADVDGLKAIVRNEIAQAQHVVRTETLLVTST